MADYDIPVYPGTMRYNPQVKDHGIIIGCLIFHGLLMHYVERCSTTTIDVCGDESLCTVSLSKDDQGGGEAMVALCQ